MYILLQFKKKNRLRLHCASRPVLVTVSFWRKVTWRPGPRGRAQLSCDLDWTERHTTISQEQQIFPAQAKSTFGEKKIFLLTLQGCSWLVLTTDLRASGSLWEHWACACFMVLWPRGPAGMIVSKQKSLSRVCRASASGAENCWQLLNGKE